MCVKCFATRNARRDAQGQEWRIDAWSIVGFAVGIVSVFLLELMGTNMSALVIGTWEVLRVGPSALEMSNASSTTMQCNRFLKIWYTKCWVVKLSVVCKFAWVHR